MIRSSHIVAALFGLALTGLASLHAQNNDLHRELYEIDKLKQDFKLLSVSLEEMYPSLTGEKNCIVVYSGNELSPILYLEFPKTGIRIKFPVIPSACTTIEGDQYKNLDYGVEPNIYKHVQAKDPNLKFVRGLIQ